MKLFHVHSVVFCVRKRKHRSKRKERENFKFVSIRGDKSGEQLPCLFSFLVFIGSNGTRTEPAIMFKTKKSVEKLVKKSTQMFSSEKFEDDLYDDDFEDFEYGDEIDVS